MATSDRESRRQPAGRRRPPDTAEAQLERILHILAAAGCAGHDGIALADLAAGLGTTEEAVLADIAKLEERDYYHPAGSELDLVVLVEDGRVISWGVFDRPLRLTLREAAALGMALRARAAEADGEQGTALLALARDLETRLASADPDALVRAFGFDPADGAEGGTRMLLERSVERRTPVEIQYFKPGAEAPASRVVHPYGLACAEGRWYVVAHCTLRGATRVFRLDRILHATVLEGTFERPGGFDVAGYLADGRMYHADADVEAVVRYSPTIARWVREHGPVEELADGAVRVRHRVADPRWLVRHVLQYAGEAEVLEPPELRAAVAHAAARLRG